MSNIPIQRNTQGKMELFVRLVGLMMMVMVIHASSWGRRQRAFFPLGELVKWVIADMHFLFVPLVLVQALFLVFVFARALVLVLVLLFGQM